MIDVAGGRGGLLRAVLTQHPNLTGILFDRPETVNDHLLHGEGLSGRRQTEGGDIFTAPQGGDLYVLRFPDEPE
ncbi:methyltransferase [Streptomyces sp. NPDC059455]|uniref:methyltransferase n=1 Tax=Streptomyces sp. NPDC059455 TaxID=3346837 RepID=UPI00368B383E